MKRYNAYRDSGVEWIGEIPKNWETLKLKFLGNLYSGLSDKKGEDFSKEYILEKQPFIPFTNIYRNLYIDEADMQYVSIKKNEKQNIVNKNDILFLMSSETLEEIGITSLKLNNNQVYLNSFCKGFKVVQSKIEPKYLNFLLHSPLYRTYFSTVGRGFTRINIKQEYILNLSALLPPKQEQIKIANYLDQKTEQIDKTISQKKELIKLIKERKQILIKDAITQGIDKTISMIESGIEWLGKVPKHWDIKKGKYLFKEIDERSKDGKEELLSVSHMTGITPRSEKNVTMFMSEDYTGSKTCQKDDLVINIMWAWMGALGVSDREGIISSSYGIYRQIEPNTFNSSYLEYLLRTNDYIAEYNRRSTGLHVSRLRLYSDRFLDMKIAIPPIEEQNAIINFIKENNSKIDKAINLQEKQIERLKELKETLIDSCVTGKVKIP